MTSSCRKEQYILSSNLNMVLLNQHKATELKSFWNCRLLSLKRVVLIDYTVNLSSQRSYAIQTVKEEI